MIPITVVTGFLGTGKTSLLAHLLDNTPDRTIAVVVNDMAPRSIDGLFLRGGEFLQFEGNLIRTIAGGRVGAGRKDALIAEILDLLETDPTPEAILVETSGGSPVLALAESLQNEKSLSGRTRLDSIITVVDTQALAGWWNDGLLRPVLTDQISAADLVILNKYDQAGFLARFRARRIVKSANRNVAMIPAEFGRLDPDDILDTRRRGDETTPVARDRRSNPNHYPLIARQLEENRPFDPDRLDQWLNRDWPGIIRIKGFLWLATDMTHVYVIDAAGSQRELGLEGTWYGALPPDEIPDDPQVKNALKKGPYQDRCQSITVIGLPEAVEREMRNLRSALLSATELDRGHQAWATLSDPIRLRFAADEQAEHAASTPD